MRERERTEPTLITSEKEMWCGWLDYHRATLLMKIDGVPDEAARRPMVGSGTSLLGLVRHLAFAENYWFGQVFAGDDEMLPRNEPGGDVEAETVAGVTALYEQVCDRSRAIVDPADLDDFARGTVDNRRGPASGFSLRWILAHMLEETARHNGHADILREQIDGSIGQ